MSLRWLRPMLCAMAMAIAIAPCAVAADQHSTHEAHTHGMVRVHLSAHPNDDATPAAALDIASFGTVHGDVQQQTELKQEAAVPATALSGAKTDSSAGDVSAAVVDQQHSTATAHSPSEHSQSRVYLPVPDHMQEDPLQPLFSFDAATVTETMQTDTKRMDSAASTSAADSGRAHVSAFASLVLRVQRRVTSVGFWAPNARGPPQADPAVPPSTPPGVTSNTLNLLATATYARSAGSISRALHLSVLPGPSFARGSMAAHAERFGPKATGFQHALFTLRDRRALVPASADPIDAAASTATRGPGEDLVSFAAEEAASGPVEPRLPGFGPVGTLRTMSGQHNENWIIYSGGVLRPSAATDAAGQAVRLVHNVALYTLLVTAWHDPQLVRAHMDAHRVLTEAALASGAPLPPPLSYNALGVRLRVTADFAVRPFERGVAVLTVPSEGTGEGGTWNNQAAMSAAELHGEMAHIGSGAGAATAVSYARIVDFVMHQQRKLVLIGVAYDDGFIRVISRAGTVRNELHTGNETVLMVAMSNWGTSTSLGAATGGGARDPNGPLNGANNGNQHLVYVTPSGIGIVRMARIFAHVDSYCRWEADASLGIANGREISAVAFDPLAHSILYLASHATDTLVVLHTRLGWNHAQSASNFDAAGLRLPCPPGGCACHASASVRMRFAAANSGASGALMRPQYTLLPLRGFLLVGSADAQAIALYNTSTINSLPHEPGLEFMLERQVGSGPARGAGSGEPASQLHLEHLTGDRIELVIAGMVGRCEHSECPVAATSDPQPLHLLQHYLPQPEHTSKASAFTSWMGSSRVPLFLLGLAGVFAWQWLQKRRRAGTGPGARGGEGDAAEMEAMLARFGRGGRGKAGGRSADFDPKSFMSDFEAWQRTQQGGGGGGGGGRGFGASARSAPKPGSRSSAHPAQRQPRYQQQQQQQASSPAYFDILESDRARVRNASARLSGPGGAARASFGLHQLDDLQRQRVEMRRRLDAMEDEAALRELGVGGGAVKMGTTPRSTTTPASARPSSTSAPAHLAGAAAASSASDANSSAFERFTDPDAERAFANDPSDGMRAESMRGVGYDSDDDDDDEEEEEEDGAGHRGSYDDYQYDHAEYSSARSSSSRPGGARSGGGDTAALLDLHRATGSSAHTFPIDSLEGMSFSHEDELARFGTQFSVEEDGPESEGEEDDEADSDGPAPQLQSMRSRTAAQRATHVSQPFLHDTYAVDHPSEHMSGFGRGADSLADYRDAVSYDSDDDIHGDEGEFVPTAEGEEDANGDDYDDDDASVPRFIDADHRHAQHVQDEDLDLDHDDDAPDEWIDEQQIDEAERSMRLARLQQADELQANDENVTRESTA